MSTRTGGNSERRPAGWGAPVRSGIDHPYFRPATASRSHHGRLPRSTSTSAPREAASTGPPIGKTSATTIMNVVVTTSSAVAWKAAAPATSGSPISGRKLGGASPVASRRRPCEDSNALASNGATRLTWAPASARPSTRTSTPR